MSDYIPENYKLRNFININHTVFIKCSIFIGLLFIFSCGNSEEESVFQENIIKMDSSNTQSVEEDIVPEKSTDVYKLEKREVVFFVISKREMRELMHEIGDSYRWETEALFNNFTNQAKTFQSILKKHNIKCVLSNNQQFEIKLRNGKVQTFNRIEKDQILGEIISDGEQDPIIEFGMYTNNDLAKLIEEFYKIKNLGYVPADTLKTTNEPEISP